MANQIPVIAILMIVQAALELIMAALLYFAAFFIPTMFGFMDEAMKKDPAFPRGVPQQELQAMTTLMLVVYLAMGTAGLIASVLHLVAGIRNLRYRGRTLGLVALFGGLASIATCYCSLTTIGLTIYGLIVYLNAESVRAFQLGQEGLSSEEIRRALVMGARPFREEPPPDHRLSDERPPDERLPDERPPEEGIKPAGGP